VPQAPAAILFTERARDVLPTFDLTDASAGAVAAICRRVDGLPLALELAAGWIRLLPPAMLLEHLDRGLLALAGGPRDLPPRQQTMRDAIAWSYDLLAPEERACFRALSVFAGGFTLESAEAAAVAAATNDGSGTDGRGHRANPDSLLGPRPPAPSILDLLTSLYDKSLLVPLPDPTGESRFAMLETIREFARSELAAVGDEDAARAAHAASFAALAEVAAAALEGPEQGAWLARLETEHDNLRAALAWAAERGDRALGLRLTTALWFFWVERGHAHEGSAWFQRFAGADGEAALAGLPEMLRARALFAGGILIGACGDFGRAVPLLSRALSLARAAADTATAARTVNVIGFAAVEAGDAERAIPLLEEARGLFAAVEEPAFAAMNLGLLAVARLLRGEIEQAAALAAEALARQRAIGNAWGAGMALDALGEIARTRGDLEQAERCFAEAASGGAAQGNYWTTLRSLVGLGLVAAGRGEAERAARLLGAAEAAFDATGDTVHRRWGGRGHAEAVAAAQATLGAPAFAAAWAAAGTDARRSDRRRYRVAGGRPLPRRDGRDPDAAGAGGARVAGAGPVEPGDRRRARDQPAHGRHPRRQPPRQTRGRVAGGGGRLRPPPGARLTRSPWPRRPGGGRDDG
jgi:tetratricopeptide (TPR) repeat protein